MSFKAFIAALAGAACVSAHGYVEQITIKNRSFPGYNPSNAPWTPNQNSIGWENWATDTGFVSAKNLQSADIICHIKGKNAPKLAKVKAGGTVSLRWTSWPSSHHGPIIDYIADCHGNCKTVDKAKLEWAKIAEKGQLSLGSGAGNPGKWADDLLFETGMTWNVKIPANLAPGQYVLRHEIIALHEGHLQGGAQFYPQCISIKVTGSGKQVPQGGVVGTSLYKMNDPGVYHNIYNDENKPTYKIPGPAKWQYA
ncbi:glycoside hydrolase [Microdochium trichocladiopsis]|uniref:lytic cellulose monooxygenase (C4-dehydrogenating) n=1 Tax=Microdochium trichocladiopsis TaxID=1682393 RepID=A0A9P8Y0L2_9PEZI|nr:glycoside hydrolase [Microdochium trichocladiopsis]KAH7027628.1 glycoside hydrolase [Microdochium trichocladiopsis]